MTDMTLAPLREELASQRAALEKTLAAIEIVAAFVKDGEGRGLAVQVEQADCTRIRIRIDLDGGEVPTEASTRGAEPTAPGNAPETTSPAKVAEPRTTPRKLSTELKPALWTDVEDATAVRMYREGATLPDIAATLGRPIAGTTFRLRKLRKRLGIAARGNGRPGASRANQAKVPPSSDGGREGRVDAARRSNAAPDQSGAAPRPERSLQAKPVSAGTLTPQSGLTFAQRALATRLAALPFSDWTFDDDLDLVEAIVRGTKVDAVAADLERARADCLARWKLLCPTPGPEAQADLMAVLRRRVAEARGAA